MGMYEVRCGVREVADGSSGPVDATGSGRLTVWHGTTADAAERIQVEGLRPTPTAEFIAGVAVEHGVDPAAVLAALERHKRFVSIQDNRDGRLWFAASADDAVAWAQNAPEARWEALWGVWWVTHDPADPSPWADSEASGWHLRQFLDIAPVVVGVSVPPENFCDRSGDPLGVEKARQWVEFGARELCVVGTIDAGHVTEVRAVPRHVRFTSMAGLLGISMEDLEARVKAGELVRPRLDRVQNHYWLLDEVRHLIL